MKTRIRINDPKTRKIVTIVVWATLLILFLGQMLYFNFIEPKIKRMGVPEYYNYKERIDHIENKLLYEDEKISFKIEEINIEKEYIKIILGINNKTDEVIDLTFDDLKINEKEITFENRKQNIRLIPNTLETGYDIKIEHLELDRNKIGKISSIALKTSYLEEELIYNIENF